MLGLPAEQADRWRAEVATWWSARPDARGRRGPAWPPSPPKVYERWCYGCNRAFITRAPQQQSCSQACEDRLHAARRTSRLDNALKRAVQHKLQASGSTPTAADRAVSVAAQLDVRLAAGARALLVQAAAGAAGGLARRGAGGGDPAAGGTADDRWRAIGRKATAEERRRWASALWHDETYATSREQIISRGAAARRGQPQSPEHRARIAAGNRAHWAQTPRPPRTFRARALSARGNCRRHHPEWSPEEVEERTIARLTARWSLPDPRITWILLHVQPVRTPRRGPRPDDERHDFIRERFAAAGRGPWDTPRGFFPAVRQALLDAGHNPPGVTDLERSWRLHLARPERGTGCLACAECQANMSSDVS